MNDKRLIDADKPLSKSLIWNIQRAYFQKAGMQAWQDDVVPHAISCNPFMARAYARLIVGYLQDCAADLDPAAPLYIIELGAGSGRLTHHLIYQLLPMLAGLANFDQMPQVKFVLTDFTPDVIKFWQQHPKLQQLVAEGILDFALFDVESPRHLRLLNSKTTIAPQNSGNPIVLLANYFFDSIPQDSFVIEDGELGANLLSLYSGQPELDLNAADLWDQLSLAYEPLPLQGPPYETALYNDILADYEAQLPDTTLTFPHVGLDCLQYWMGFKELLLLTADRGYSHAESLIGQGNPHPNLHGSFSMMVNYHAITEFVERSGGRAFVPPHYQDNVQTLAYVLNSAEKEFTAAEQAFEQSVVHNGPDDYFALRQHLLKQIPEMAIDQFLSLMRWSADEADVLRPGLDHLASWVEQEPAWQEDVLDMLERVKAQYLAIRSDDDLILKIDQLIDQIAPEE